MKTNLTPRDFRLRTKAIGITVALGWLAQSPLTHALEIDKVCKKPYAQWQQYKASFLSENGRIIDNGNKNISHSEGQGYGMLMAVYFGDRESFETLWRWTQTHLQREQDSLFSWKWQEQPPNVPDENNASDGDVFIAWALLRAFDKWRHQPYFGDAKAIITELQSTQLRSLDDEQVLLPGTIGFEKPHATVVNPAYWVYPAFNEFVYFGQEWQQVAQSGLRILGKNQYGGARLPTDWLQFSRQQWQPADGFLSEFSYSSYRIPLYLIWGGNQHLLSLKYLDWLEKNNVAWVNLLSGKTANYAPPAGAFAVGELVQASIVAPSQSSGIHQRVSGQDYYSDSLVLLAHIAYQERFCK
ncbi:endoglucanase [Vibrio sp. SM6]|uniref:Glucanase n=1 Tax=Vibrio agarilyticus TaxID=2726741 RepID=A0A7X8YH23_9VIBR|nr:glycosyl hydrolase family 8 [Vibrio agarilyticus]NLS13001.1 endoglucanase [Vibrio agarilyticus]